MRISDWSSDVCSSDLLDDLSYVRKDQVETSALFELIAHRYDRHSLAITANQPFSAWDNVFPDPALAVAAIDRLVHHSTIIELNAESSRKRSAVARINGIGREASTERGCKNGKNWGCNG